MCELFALSAQHPADVSFSLTEFARHGGHNDHHADGWGLAWYEGPAATVLREPRPAARSPLVRTLLQHGVRSTLVISHIRKATRGAISLANTQPFRRELGGHIHVFAHNGDLPGLTQPQGQARPVGQTDSEIAFCQLMARLDALWRQGDGVPALGDRLEAVASCAALWRDHGPANFLYSDGDALFAHGHRRTQAASGRIEPPGLLWLERRCQVPIDGVEIHTQDQSIILLASVPLTGERWIPLAEGEVLAIQDGAVVTRHPGNEPTDQRAACP